MKKANFFYIKVVTCKQTHVVGKLIWISYSILMTGLFEIL